MNEKLNKIIAGRNPREVWLTIDQVQEVCPGCAQKMKTAGMYKVRASQLISGVERQEKVAEICKAIRASKFTSDDLKKLKEEISSK